MFCLYQKSHNCVKEGRGFVTAKTKGRTQSREDWFVPLTLGLSPPDPTPSWAQSCPRRKLWTGASFTQVRSRIAAPLRASSAFICPNRLFNQRPTVLRDRIHSLSQLERTTMTQQGLSACSSGGPKSTEGLTGLGSRRCGSVLLSRSPGEDSLPFPGSRGTPGLRSWPPHLPWVVGSFSHCHGFDPLSCLHSPLL